MAAYNITVKLESDETETIRVVSERNVKCQVSNAVRCALRYFSLQKKPIKYITLVERTEQ